jgi:hypothetical protein
MDALDHSTPAPRSTVLRTRRPGVLAALAVVGVAAAFAPAALAPVSAPMVAAGEASSARPVLLELFTSQGCSSCPPADRLLSRLAEQSAGAIVPLAFHVDSWNRLGWRDPFSRREWTVRHEAYTRSLDQLPYTPQAVIAGRAAMVGSDEGAIRAAVAAAATLPAAELSLALEPSAEEIGVAVAVELPASLRQRKLHLLLALFETGLETPVERGENGGRILRNDYVVRTLERAALLRANGPAHSEHGATLELASDWELSNLGVAAFLQDPGSLEIHGAAALAVAAAGAGGSTIRR